MLINRTSRCSVVICGFSKVAFLLTLARKRAYSVKDVLRFFCAESAQKAQHIFYRCWCEGSSKARNILDEGQSYGCEGAQKARNILDEGQSHGREGAQKARPIFNEGQSYGRESGRQARSIFNESYGRKGARQAPFERLGTVFLCCLVLLTACGGGSGTVVSSATATRGVTPERYVSRVLFQGKLHPDDLAFTQDPNTLLFSDSTDGTINTITLDGKITVLLKGLGEPEGMVVLPDKSLVFSSEKTNRILMLTPGAHTPTVLRTMPGKLSEDPCKSGVDDIAWDAFTHTIIVPDSPTGEVYSMSADGKSLKLLASGMSRPVDATADAQGNLYVADQCGGAVWRIALDGTKTRIGGFSMPDALMIDPHGNLLVTDLGASIHGLIRMNLVTGKRETLASEGYLKPQGLLVDAHDTIYIADDSTNKIVEYKPA